MDRLGTQAGLDERDARLQRLRAAMDEERLDALLIYGKGHWWTSRGYFRYLTDFHLWGHDGLIFLPRDGEPALSLTSAAVADMIAERGWITDVRGDYDVAPSIVQLVKARGLSKGRLGLVGRDQALPLGVYERLREGLPEAEVLNADRTFDQVRAIKSPLEIQQNRELWHLAKSAMEHFVDVLEPGRSERELAAEALKVVYAGGARDHLVFFNQHIPTDRPVRLEDILSYHMEICGESGHWCELTVSLAYRDLSRPEIKLMESELLAYGEMRKAAIPGRLTLRGLADIFERVLKSEGWSFQDRIPEHYDFHGHGMDVIEWPRFSPIDQRYDTTLEEGMEFSYHPHRLVVPDIATGINEDIVIGRDGAERLSGDWDLHWRVIR